MEKRPKKVIFVAGSSYSGSTILNLILGNDQRRNALGEIRALFCPKKTHHHKKINELKKDTKWERIFEGGLKNLYSNLFAEYPEIDVLIDSSKDPIWISEQIQNLKKSNIPSNVVLIYKTPIEFAQSALKRNQQQWERKWLNYHLSFFELIKDYRQISYESFVNNTEASLKELFNDLELNYTKESKDFWLKKDNFNFFGNNHTNYQAKESNDEIGDRIIDDNYKKDYRKIKSSTPLDAATKQNVLQKIGEDKNFLMLENKLNDPQLKINLGLKDKVKIIKNKLQFKILKK